MDRWTMLRGATAIAASLTATHTFADVTGAEIWEAWKSHLTDFGYDIKGNEISTGDGLTVSGVTLTVTLPEDEGTFVISLPELAFADQGDGTVKIDFPAVTTVEVMARPEDAEDVDATVELTYTGLSTTASGDIDDLTYSYSAAGAQIALTDLVVDEEPMEGILFDLTMANILGQTSVEKGDTRIQSQKFSAEDLNYEIRMVIPEDDVSVVSQATSDSLSFEGTAEIPMEFDADDPQDIFDKGLAFAGIIERGASTMSMTAVEDGQPFNMTAVSSGGEAEIAMDGEGFAIGGFSEGVALDATVPDVPFPVSVAVEEVGFDLLMPLAEGADEQDFGFGFTLAGLTVSDLLWNIFDAGAILPRDPATVNIDLDGTMRLFRDLMDPSIEDSDEFPGEVNSVTLNDVTIEVAGASLYGEGAFTFDNSDMESFDGFPRPEGELAVNLKGANGLLDKLIQMGFVSEGDALGARMMTSMVAVPGPGEDELNSTIIINDQGHILANGQRLK